MLKMDNTEQYKKILNVFAEFLAGQTNTDFVYSDRFGYLLVTSWNTQEDRAYDVVHIESEQHLCELLVDIFIYDYLSTLGAICMNEQEAELMRREQLQPCFDSLPDYQELFDAAFAKTLRPLICK